MHNSVEEFILSLNAGDVFLFHGKIDTPQMHYQVILNRTINSETDLIFASIATKQIHKRQDFHRKNGLSPETLVIIEAGEVAFLKIDSCFDCNYPKLYNRFELFGDHLCGNLKYQGCLSEDILQRLYSGIEASDIISERHKKIIRGESM